VILVELVSVLFGNWSLWLALWFGLWSSESGKLRILDQSLQIHLTVLMIRGSQFRMREPSLACVMERSFVGMKLMVMIMGILG